MSESIWDWQTRILNRYPPVSPGEGDTYQDASTGVEYRYSSGRWIEKVEHKMRLTEGYNSLAFKCYMVKIHCKCGDIITASCHPVDEITEKWRQHKENNV